MSQVPSDSEPHRPLAGRRLLLAGERAGRHAAAFAEAGGQVVSVSDGLSAVGAWERSEESGRPFDAALLDEALPALSGPTVTTWLRQGGFGGVIVGLAAPTPAGPPAAHWRAWGADLVLLSADPRLARPVPLVAALTRDPVGSPGAAGIDRRRRDSETGRRRTVT